MTTFNTKTITFLVLILLTTVTGVFLLSKPAQAQGGQGQMQIRGDSGLIKLGPNQILRVSVAASVRPADVRFRRLDYTEAGGASGIKQYNVSNSVQSEVVDLAQGNGATYDVPVPASACRIVVSGNAKVQIQFMIVDLATGEIQSFQEGSGDGQSI